MLITKLFVNKRYGFHTNLKRLFIAPYYDQFIEKPTVTNEFRAIDC